MVQACKNDRYFCDDTHCTAEKNFFEKRGDNRSAKKKHKQNIYIKVVNVIDNINIIDKPYIYRFLFIKKSIIGTKLIGIN